MTEYFVDSDTSPWATAHHEAGHLVMAWLFRVPYEHATIQGDEAARGQVRGGGRLAPDRLDLTIEDPAERKRLAQALAGECYIMISGIVVEMRLQGFEPHEGFTPDTYDPYEDTAVVRRNVKVIQRLIRGSELSNLELLKKQIHFQIWVAKVLFPAPMWNLVVRVADLLMERQTITKSDYMPILEAVEHVDSVAQARKMLQVL